MSLNMTLRKRKALSPPPLRRMSPRLIGSSSATSHGLSFNLQATENASGNTDISDGQGSSGNPALAQEHNHDAGNSVSALRAFQLLPIELNQNIAAQIESDVHFGLFAQICRATWTAIAALGRGAFRVRFLIKYDMPRPLNGGQAMLLYVHRRMLLTYRVFQAGASFVELARLWVLKDLVLESFANAGLGEKAYSNNLVRLRQYLLDPFLARNVMRYHQENAMALPADPQDWKVIGSNFLQHFTDRGVRESREQNRLFKTLRVVFTHFSLDLSNQFPARDLYSSQQVVYGINRQLIKWRRQERVDMDHLLHISNFFQYHIQMVGADTLNPLFISLPYNAKPQAWTQRIDGSICRPLGTKWKGAYAYLPGRNDVDTIRRLPACDAMFNDAFDEDKGLLEMDFNFSPSVNNEEWPDQFEVLLNAMPYSVIDDSDGTSDASDPSLPFREPIPGKDWLPFRGNSWQIGDNDRSGFAGILHRLQPQEGIPGWQRFSMMKFPNGSTHTGVPPPFRLDRVALDAACWCYEGVVIPGGKIIIGRYWNAMDDDSIKNTGPFIFWEIDPNAYADH